MVPPADDDLEDLLAARLEDYLHQRSTRSVSSERDRSDRSSLPEEIEHRLARARTVVDQLAELTTEDSTLPFPPRTALPEPGASFGRFRNLTFRGLGGFGVVYKATDPQTQRDVAIKVPRVEILLSDEARQRFHQEAKATAKLDHPNIITVLESGETKGLPYIVAVYCSGDTLAAWMKSVGKIDVDHALQIAQPLAEAIAHAHHRGVMHRDIKPSNILLAPAVSPSSELPFIPKLTDFGLAKLAESSAEQTRTGAILGSVRYMSPEQAAGRTREVGVASDIYSLGMVLYELLTGRTAFEGDVDAAIFAKVLNEPPVSPRRLRPEIPRDVEAICLKCLEKLPQDRYRTALELAEDLRRALQGEPTAARPIKKTEHLWRWAKRRPAVAVLSLVSLLLLLTTAVGGTWYSIELSRALRENEAALRRVEASELQAQHLLYAADMKLAGEALERRDLLQVRQLLDRHIPISADADERTFAWHFLDRMIDRQPRMMRKYSGEIYCQALGTTHGQIIVGGNRGTVLFLDPESMEVQRSFPTGQGEINAIALSDDGRLIATAGKDGAAKVWEADTGQLRSSFAACDDGEAFGIGFVRDSSHVVAGGDDPSVKVWRLSDGKLVQEIAEHQEIVEALSISPNGNQFIIGDSMGGYAIIDTHDFSVVSKFQSQAIDGFYAAAYSPSGDRIALTGDCEEVLLLRNDGTHESYIPVSAHAKYSLAWDNSGETLYVADRAGAITAVDIQRDAIANSGFRYSTPENAVLPEHLWPKVIGVWQAHGGRIWELRYEPATTTLASFAEDGTISRWDQRTIFPWSRLAISDNGPEILQFRFCRPGWGVGTRVTDVIVATPSSASPTDEYTFTKTKHCSLNLSPDRSIAAVFRKSLDEPHFDLYLFKTNSLSLLSSMTYQGVKDKYVTAFAPNNRHLAITPGDSQRLQLIDTLTQSLLAEAKLANIHFLAKRTAKVGSQDCFVLADNNEIVALDAGSLKEAGREVAHVGGVHSIMIDPKGAELFTLGNDGMVKSWDASRLVATTTYSGQHTGAYYMEITSDGTTLVTFGDSPEVRLWDRRTSQQLFAYTIPMPDCRQFETSPDGRYVVLTFAHRRALVLDMQEK